MEEARDGRRVAREAAVVQAKETQINGAVGAVARRAEGGLGGTL